MAATGTPIFSRSAGEGDGVGVEKSAAGLMRIGVGIGYILS